MTNENKVQWKWTLDVLSRAKDGDTAAFSQLAEQYGPLMGAVSSRYVSYYTDLSEARQATLRGLHEAVCRWDGTHFSSLQQLHYFLKKEIHRYVRNETARMAYDRRHYGQSIDSGGQWTDLPDAMADDAPGPAEAAIETERNQILQKALQNLPPRERQIVTGRIYENKTVRELGAHFGVTHQYISKIYGKAIQKLRDWLTPYDIQLT